MAEITAAMVKDLREKTGAGMMDCKKALAETSGDMEGAIIFLREKGLAAAAKKAGRVAAEGLVRVFIDGSTAALAEVNCETDFVANTDEFGRLVKDLALHIASPAAPTYLSLTFGLAFADLDLDGWQDLVIANGHIEPHVQDVHLEAVAVLRPSG